MEGEHIVDRVVMSIQPLNYPSLGPGSHQFGQDVGIQKNHISASKSKKAGVLGSERNGVGRSTPPTSAKRRDMRVPILSEHWERKRCCRRICLTSSSMDRLFAAATMRKRDFKVSSMFLKVKVAIQKSPFGFETDVIVFNAVIAVKKGCTTEGLHNRNVACIDNRF